ncbi:MAG: hypothetical protein ACP5L4_04535 [Thermoplasmata archaeon]
MIDDKLDIYEAGKNAYNIQIYILKDAYSKYFISWGTIFIAIVLYMLMAYIVNKQFLWIYYFTGYPLIIITGSFLNYSIFSKTAIFKNFSIYFRKKNMLEKNMNTLRYLLIILISIYSISILIFIFNLPYNQIFYFIFNVFLYIVIMLIGLFAYRSISLTFDFIPEVWKISFFIFFLTNIVSIILNYFYIISGDYILTEIISYIIWVIAGLVWILSGIKTLRGNTVNG